ncbi:hypothetical protein H0B56_06480 [Haloechinothrix sp. YIM 98757]|uniref:Excreted virulence factor EspC, type VII ESX diderm n=1 Tax=Haloechinothrix aidingensis TaxID=2752311 RepID=A0A838A1Z4_9PSEU|nr:hypothetical protein [Haloechinothrix aidingensis]MBA0125183.1 hypothetical protein [Haloechinothrix aidingensis]
MNGPERPRISTSLDTAASEIRNAIQHVEIEEVPTQVELRDAGWHLTHLSGDLAELAAILGEQASRYGERNVLSEVSGEDPGPTVARAYRELATARKALEQAEAAAREYYTAISRVYPAVSPDVAGDVP